MKTFNMHAKTVILSERNEVLLLKQNRTDGKTIWDLPGSTFTEEENFDETVITGVHKEIGYYIYLGKIMGVTDYKNNKSTDAYVIIEGNILHGELILSKNYENYDWVDLKRLYEYQLAPWLSNYIKNNRNPDKDTDIKIKALNTNKNGRRNIPEVIKGYMENSKKSKNNDSNKKSSLEILKNTIIRTLHPKEVKSNRTNSKNKKLYQVNEKKENKITEEFNFKNHEKSDNNEPVILVEHEDDIIIKANTALKRENEPIKEKYDDKKVTSPSSNDKRVDMILDEEENLKEFKREPKVTVFPRAENNELIMKETGIQEKISLKSEKNDEYDWKYEVDQNYFEGPKISVIMPSLNVKPYIKKCIESVLNQTLKEIEIICVDSGSTDGTTEILEEYRDTDPRVSLFKSNVKSYGKQVNIGLSKAKGEYISIIETDDYIEIDMLKKLYDLSEEGTVDIIKGNFFHLDDSDSENPTFKADNDKILSNDEDKFELEDYPQFLNGHPSIWAGIYRKQFLEENQITFLEEPDGGWVDNVFFFQTAIKAHSIKYIDTPLYYYRISNPNSSSNNISSYTIPMKRILNIFDVFNEYEYENRDVCILFYNRLFRYIEIILENIEMDTDKLTLEEKEYIYMVLQKVDEKIVSREMILNFQKIYYKYKSPLFLKT